MKVLVTLEDLDWCWCFIVKEVVNFDYTEQNYDTWEYSEYFFHAIIDIKMRSLDLMVDFYRVSLWKSSYNI